MGIVIKKNKEQPAPTPADLGAKAMAEATPAPTQKLKKPTTKAQEVESAVAAQEVTHEEAQAQEQTTMVTPVAEIETQHADGATENETIHLPQVQVPVQHAEVGLSMGLTKNLGDYNSMKFSVTLKIPCAVDAQEIEDTYTTVKEWVDDKVNSINAEINAMLG